MDDNIYNEESTGWIEISFVDKDRVAAVPSAVSYTIHDKLTGTLVRDSTSVSPLASTIEIELEPTDTIMENTGYNIEEKLITLTITFAGGRQKTAEVPFRVKNLKHIVTVEV